MCSSRRFPTRVRYDRQRDPEFEEWARKLCRDLRAEVEAYCKARFGKPAGEQAPSGGADLPTGSQGSRPGSKEAGSSPLGEIGEPLDRQEHI